MNNILSYCGLTNARMRAFEKDLPVPEFFSHSSKMSWKHFLLLNISRPPFSIKVPNPISYRSQGEYLIQAADVHFFSRVMVKLSRSSTLLVSINQATSAVASGAALVLGA